MSSYLSVVKAEYAYEAATDEELTIEEDQVLYVLEDDDADWWKVRVKTSPSEGITPDESPTGLVPAGYLVPLEALRTVTALYEYAATSEEEISIAEDATYKLYEDDGEWSLIGATDRKEVGYAPTAYLEEQGQSQGAPAVATPLAEVPPAAPGAAFAAPATTPSSSVGRALNGQADTVKTWSGVTALEGKKKKKGTLGVGNGALFFASDSDKAPVQKKSLNELTDIKAEKNKHIILTFGSEELHFTVSKDEHAEIMAKIEESREYAKTGEGEGGGADTYVPPPPPPPPSAAGLPGSKLPPPPRRMYSSSDESDAGSDGGLPNAPALAAIPAPPPPPPAPPAPAAAFAPPPVRMPTAAAAAAAAPAPPAAPRAPQPAQTAGKKAVAEYEFTAAGSEELSIAEGETLWVLDDSADDWWKVRNVRGEEGEVPASYVSLDDAAAGGADGGAEETAGDEDAARRLEEEQKAEARKERARLKEKALQDEARGLNSFSNINLPPPPRRTTTASPAPPAPPAAASSPARAVSPPAAPAPPPAPPAPAGGRAPSGRGEDREAEREERRRRHREERERQRREDELLRNRGSTSMPSPTNGHAPPVEKTRPSPARVRTWKDRSGAFKVDAEFIGLSGADGEKIRLHKLNGVVIEVPIDKMSPEDVRVLEHITRRRLGKSSGAGGDDRRRSGRGGDGGDRDRERERERRERDRPEEASPHKARPPSATAAGKRVSMAASNTRKSETDWFEFFLSAGCDVDDCSRYASNFEKDRIDESILPDLEQSTLRSLGMREGDIIRVSKHIKARTGVTPASAGPANGGGGSGKPAAAAARRGSDGPAPPAKSQDTSEDQMREDEELARKMQEELNAGRDGSGLFTNASGGIKNTRRGRPAQNRSAPSAASMDAITSSLTSGDRTRTPDIDRIASPDRDRRPSSTAPPASSGFDDDAWTPKPSVPKPSTPAPALLSASPVRSASPAAAPVPREDKDLVDISSSASAMPTTSKEPSNAQALTDAYLESIGLGKRPVSAAAPVPARQAAASPAPALQQQQQQQQPYQPSASPAYSGPRAPVAPIPINQQLLNPLIPTQTGLTGYIPTRNTASPMMPQMTGWQQPQQPQFQPQPQMMAPMQTGMQTGFGGNGMMQPQQTGYPMSQMSQLSIQPTGSPFNNPVSTSPSMFSQPQQQMGMQLPQQTGMQMPQQTGMQAPAPAPAPQTQSSQAADYQPSNVFAQMKAGQFAKPNEAPQDANKYDGLRPQQTGFAGFGPPPQQQQQPQMFPQPTGFGGMQPQQTGFGGSQQQQFGGMQPLQAQPTGFAPGGYMTGFPQQPQQTGFQQYRQY